MPEQQVRNEKQQKEMNHRALNPVSCAAIALPKGPSIARVEGPETVKQGREASEGEPKAVSKCLFVCFYFSIPE